LRTLKRRKPSAANFTEAEPARAPSIELAVSASKSRGDSAYFSLGLLVSMQMVAHRSLLFDRRRFGAGIHSSIRLSTASY
jgi:hypothetical protein